MLAVDPDYQLRGQDAQLFSHLNNIGVSILVGVMFGAVLWTVISFFPGLISPYESGFSLAVCIAVDVSGVMLIGTVTYDVVLRLVAKRELVRFLVNFPETKYLEVRTAVEWGQPPGLFSFLTGNDQRESYLTNWYFLGAFLNSPLGQFASQALFQHSRTGRLKYIDEVISLARRQRVPDQSRFG